MIADVIRLRKTSEHETYSKPFAFPAEEPFSCDHRSSDRPCVFSHPVLYGLSTVASRKGLNLAPQRKLFGYRDENQGTPWLIWLDSLTEDRIFLRATSVRVNNGSSAPLQEIFNELKNFKHLENVMVVWQYNASVPRIEETIAEVEQQGLSLIHISEPTRPERIRDQRGSRMPSSA